jgi:hypothetical protein
MESIKDEIESIKDDSDFIKDDFSEEEYIYNSENSDNEIYDDQFQTVIEHDKLDDIYYEENNIESEVDFYKKLLNKQGFIFDENKRCLLNLEEYIV